MSMTLFVDMDEVIADAYQAKIDRYNADFGTQLTINECMGKEVWQCVPIAHRETVKRYAAQDGFFRELKPIAGSKEVLEQLAERYEVYIASAAMQFPKSLREKSDWLDEHFPFIHWRNRILCGDKHILKGDILVDDRSYNLEAFKGRTLLFTSPHNIHTNGYDRVDNWASIASLLL